MGYIGQTPTAVPLTSSDIAPGTIEASDLNSTLNLSSKTVTLPAGSVTSHVTSFDDADIRSDILRLAIHQATEGNRVEFGLSNSWIDGFETDDGLATQTTVDRNTTGEYVGTSISAYGATQNLWEVSSSGSAVGAGYNNYLTRTRVTAISATAHKIRFTVNTTGAGDLAQAGFGVADSGSTHGSTNWDTVATPVEIKWSGSSGASGASQVSDWLEFTVSSSNDYIFTATNADHTNIYYYTSGLPTATASCTQAGGTSGFGTLVADVPTDDSQNDRAYFIKKIEGQELVTTVNATGTLISDPQTASTSRTSCSGVIIYEDAVGTSILGGSSGDLRIYFTANNGTNWTEASSYGTATTYSGTKKLVKLGSTNVTAGTQVAMKAVWANQVASTNGEIAGNVGTAIGTMTGGGGLSALFDGNTAQSSTAGGRGPGSGVGWVGKSWGSVRTITKVIVYPWSGGYFGGNNPSNMTITIEGSTDAAFTSPVVLETKTGLTGTTAGTQTFTSIVTTTGYAHHRVRFSNGIGTATISEVEFFEAPVTGKLARLHGWAVNY